MHDPRDPSRASAERVRHLLESARADLRDIPHFGPAREEELVERILSRTTRSLPARRSRWQPAWMSFAAAAASAAAVLLISRQPLDTAPALAATAASPVETPAIPVEGRADGGYPAVLARAREELAASASAARKANTEQVVGADAPLELRLLEARAKGLRERRWDPWLREIQLSDLGTLSLALWCEVQLDRYLLDGSRPPAWKHAVGILQHDLAQPEAPKESSRLLARALERARDYGLTADVTVARLDASDPLWNGQWFDDLAAAGREAGIAETGMWRAWVDWRGR